MIRYKYKAHGCSLCPVLHPPYIVYDSTNGKIKGRFQYASTAKEYAEMLNRDNGKYDREIYKRSY